MPHTLLQNNTIAMTAPHSAATETGLNILRQGGSAIEAMVAAAATISSVYPHMTGLGGDGFWLIHKPGMQPIAIDAGGFSAKSVDLKNYQEQESIAPRGAQACVTMAGAVSGWKVALDWAQQNIGETLPLHTLLGDALKFCKDGIEVSESLAMTTESKFDELSVLPHFSDNYLPDNKPLTAGETLKQPALAVLFKKLIANGLDDFYRGGIAETIAEELQKAGSPISLEDLKAYQAEISKPLTCDISHGALFNLGAPTQGLASLLILAQFDRLYQPDWTEKQAVHHLVEATKNAFAIRDQFVCDRQHLPHDLQSFLQEDKVATMANKINADKARDWPIPGKPGDTIWMGAMDKDGVLVSYIQSIYWEFGSGTVIPQYGLCWNNRGISFSLDKNHPNRLRPRAKPMHTLNPAMCLLKDGRRLAYGTMGGEGQPQTQAAVFHRIINKGMIPQDAIAEPRWLLGRTWGDVSNNLKIESSLYQKLKDDFLNKGHDIQEVPDNSEMMGHAGAILTGNETQAGTDPRSDGWASVEQL